MKQVTQIPYHAGAFFRRAQEADLVQLLLQMVEKPDQLIACRWPVAAHL